jgi:hypothetical protein
MENLVYLAGAVIVSALISVIIVVRNRKPTSMEASVDAFHKELKALAPEDQDQKPERRTG